MCEMVEDTRIGVFVCYCGLNIAKSVDVKVLRSFASTLPGVVYATDYEFMCSQAGQKLIGDAIKEHDLDRVVVASCSPKLHELTFRRVVKEAGLNPFLLEMANIREQCSWAHINEPGKATEKAKHIVRSSVERCRYLEEIGEMEESVKSVALVVGGGIAGIQAAMGLADYGFEVHLVERRHWLGGTALQLGRAFPTGDCGTCVSPRSYEMHRKCLYKERILMNPRIKVYTSSTVGDLSGYVGNFKARIERAPRYVDEELCIACGECERVCPIEVPNKLDLGLSKRKAIYMPRIQAVPLAFAIDGEHCTRCKKCVEVCPTKAINLDDEPMTIDVDVGTVIVATGFEEFEPAGLFGYGTHDDVITQLKLARMMDSSGPTHGRVIRPSDGRAPRNVVMIQCVGSRDKATHVYCSKICCMIALNHARSLKTMDPDLDVTICYTDMRPFGRDYERYYTDCEELGVNFVRGDVSEVSKGRDGTLKVKADLTTGRSIELDTDLVVLSSALVPSKDAEELSRVLNLPLSPDGFFMELHPKLAPIDTNVDGIFICGACQGPKDISETMAQAMGAAARAAILMAPGKIKIDLAKAIVDESLCIGCGNCEEKCPYNAIEMDPPGIARVIEVACKGCGICVAECPAMAIQLRHFKDKQLLAAIEGILR